MKKISLLTIFLLSLVIPVTVSATAPLPACGNNPDGLWNPRPGINVMPEMQVPPASLPAFIAPEEICITLDGSTPVRKASALYDAAETFTVGNCLYEIIEGNKVRIKSCVADTFTEEDLRGTVTYDGVAYEVEEIGSDCFRSKTYSPLQTDKLEIPSTVLRIGHLAFREVKSSVSFLNIIIPENVQETGVYAFSFLNVNKAKIEVYGNLTHSTINYGEIPSSRVKQGYTFYGTTYYSSESTSQIIIGDKVPVIPPYTFAFMRVNDISIGNGVESIGEAAFNTGLPLARLSLPAVEKWVSIERNATYTASNPMTFYAEGITTLLFGGEVAGSTLTIPEGVETIKTFAFGVRNWEKVILPESLKEICMDAFFNNCTIGELDLSANIELIDGAAFNCKVNQLNITSELKHWEQVLLSLNKCGNYSVNPDNKVFKCVDGSLLSADGKLLYCVPTMAQTAADNVYQIPEGVEYVATLLRNVKRKSYGYLYDYPYITYSPFTANLPYEGIRIPASFKLNVDPDWWLNPRDYSNLADNWEDYQDEYNHIYITNIFGYYLEKFEVDDANPWVRAVDGVLYSKDKEIIIRYPAGLQLDTYTMDEAVKHIGLNCFASARISVVNASTNLQTIGEYAFMGSEIIALNLKSSPTQICKGAFSVTPYLKSFTLDIEEVAPSLFEMRNYVNSLEVIYLTDKVKRIGERAFYGASQLKSVCLASQTPVDSVAHFPPYLESIGAAAFWGTQLETLELPTTLKHVGGSCFHSTPWFDKQPGSELIYFVDGELYGWRADENMPTTLDIPETTTSVAEGAFGWQTLEGALYYNLEDTEYVSVETLTLPASFKEIPEYSFMNTKIKNLTIKSAEKIGRSAFASYRVREDDDIVVNLPSNLKRIDDFAFQHFDMSEVKLPEGVESLGNQTFANSHNLREVTLPSTLKSMGIHNFSDLDFTGVSNSQVENIYSYAVEPPVLAEDGWSDFLYLPEFHHLFDAKILENTILHVPAGSLEKYRTSEYWQDFLNIVEMEETVKESGDANGDDKINVSDIAIIIDYMLERNPSNFNKAAADVNGDGKINVIDISAIIQILLSR